MFVILKQLPLLAFKNFKLEFMHGNVYIYTNKKNEMQIHIEKRKSSTCFSLENDEIGQREAVSQDWKTAKAISELQNIVLVCVQFK